MLIIKNRKGHLGNASIMPVAVFHACTKSQSVSASPCTSPLASVVTNTTPSELGGIFVCHTNRVSRGASYLSLSIVTSSTLSSSCDFCSCCFSVLTTVAFIGTGVEFKEHIFVLWWETTFQEFFDERCRHSYGHCKVSYHFESHLHTSIARSNLE